MILNSLALKNRILCARCFVQCYKVLYVIKVLILDPDKGAFHAYACIINAHNICIKENDLHNEDSRL